MRIIMMHAIYFGLGFSAALFLIKVIELWKEWRFLKNKYAYDNDIHQED